MKLKYYLIVNPHGGVRSGQKILEKVKPYFDEADAELKIIETEYAGHARDISCEIPFEGFTGLCAIGGDGTMHEMVNGIMSRKDGIRIPIGLITGGTGNSFMHDVDCLDPIEAVQRILTNRTRKIDIFRAETEGGTYFGFNIVTNPEFLKEGSAIEDTLNPHLVVIGGLNKKSINRLRSFYQELCVFKCN